MKKVVLFLIISFMFINTLYSENIDYISNIGNNSNGYERTEENNYGVNKKWNINSSNLNNVINTPYVDSSEKIYDFADIVSDDDEIIIKNNIQEFISKTNMDMVIVTIDKPYFDDSENETYAADFYDYNDFGIDFNNYSGVLLLRNVYSEDPYFNVYAFGDAQIYFDYDRCESMLDDIYPFLRNKNYVSGFNLFINDFSSYYDLGYSTDDYYVDEMGFLKRKFNPPFGISTIAALITTIVSSVIMVGKNKMVKVANGAQEYLDKRSINYSTKNDNLVRSFTTHHYVSSSSGSSGGSSSGGSFHSSFGSSGGGHFSGGGRHG